MEPCCSFTVVRRERRGVKMNFTDVFCSLTMCLTMTVNKTGKVPALKELYSNNGSRRQGETDNKQKKRRTYQVVMMIDVERHDGKSSPHIEWGRKVSD